MSDQSKPLRSVSEIQGEYQALCTKLGHLEYQIDAIKKDAELVKSTLRDLNLEAAASHASEQKAKEKEAQQQPTPEAIVVS